jgi:hypothetical protein
MKASMAASKSEVTGKGLTNRTANDTADTSTFARARDFKEAGS